MALQNQQQPVAALGSISSRPTPTHHHRPLRSGRSSTVVAVFRSRSRCGHQAAEEDQEQQDKGYLRDVWRHRVHQGERTSCSWGASPCWASRRRCWARAVTGKGILAQLNLETGIPIYEAEPLLLFFILFTLLGALGDRGRFVDTDSDTTTTTTGLERAVIPPGKGFRAALGLREGGPLFGFTKANELFVGRLAQLGIAFSLIGEIVTGKGALAQLNIETGVPINEIEPLLLFSILFFFFFAAINPGTGNFVTDDDDMD